MSAPNTVVLWKNRRFLKIKVQKMAKTTLKHNKKAMPLLWGKAKNLRQVDLSIDGINSTDKIYIVDGSDYNTFIGPYYGKNKNYFPYYRSIYHL